MRVLLTGGFGYLAGRIANSLRAGGNQVVLSAREIPAPAAEWARDFEFRRCDVLDEQPKALLAGIEGVVHLASLDEREAVSQPARAVLVSGEGTRLMLAASRAAGVGRFVFFSTFHVYGPTAPPRVTEETATKASHPYAIAHLTGEGFCRASIDSGQDVAILRVSNGYGAPVWTAVDRWTLAHNDFSRQAVQTARIVLRSSGEQHRDFVGVEDIADATRLVLMAERRQLEDGVFNVGGRCSMSVFEVALRVQAVARSRLGIDCPIERPPPVGAVAEQLDFSIDRLGKLGFTPRDRFAVETERLFALLESTA